MATRILICELDSGNLIPVILRPLWSKSLNSFESYRVNGQTDRHDEYISPHVGTKIIKLLYGRTKFHQKLPNFASIFRHKFDNSMKIIVT